jgi:hypothetical protein
VIKLSQSGVNEETIIRYIEETKSSYSLSQTQVRRMLASGVSQKVIDFMVDTGR